MKKFITLGILIMLVGLMAFTPVIFKAHSSKNTLVHNCGPDFDIQNLGVALLSRIKIRTVLITLLLIYQVGLIMLEVQMV